MIKLEKVSVMNIENAIRGARNPMNSWAKSDSGECTSGEYCEREIYGKGLSCRLKKGGCYVIGHNDLALAKKLCNAGSDHRKFMRQIFVSMDITAPLYWWKEYDTYKVGTVANSCSTMHKIHEKEFVMSDFSAEQMYTSSLEVLGWLISELNRLRGNYSCTNDKKYWYSMIQLLPSSYNQLRTVTLTYENLIAMYHNRKNHKLDEWVQLCKWVETLPYSELITGE